MPRTIQLQHADGTVYRHIGLSELRDMENRQEVDVIVRRKSGCVTTIARLRPSVEVRKSMKEASKPCITYADVLANVGLVDRPNSTQELSQRTIDAARTKTLAYSGRSVIHPLRDRLVTTGSTANHPEKSRTDAGAGF